MTKPLVQTFNVIEDRDFDALVTKTFGQPFEFAADHEASGGNVYVFRHINAEAIQGNEYGQRKVREFETTGNYGYLTHTLLEHLCTKGIIPAGNYLIEV